MQHRNIESVESSLASQRERWQLCRDKRLAFERQMDINACEDHRTLQHLRREEEKSERDFRLAEDRVFEVQARRFRIFGLDLRRVWEWLRGLLLRSPSVSS